MTTLHTLVLVVHVLIGAMIVALVLLQRGKGADAGAAFGAGASGTVFGARGSANFLSRSTAVLALLFFGTSLGLAYLGTQRRAPESLLDVAEVAPGKRHSIPSVSDCRSCHDSARTEILGFDALNLSDDRDPNAPHAEALTPEMITLRTLTDENLISPKRTALVSRPPRIKATSPQARAALGYLSTNCGSCHNRDSSIASLGLDLRQNPPCSAVGKRGHWVVPESPEASRIINPGHPESSAMIRRIKSRRPISQMPPIGTVNCRKPLSLASQARQSKPVRQ